MIRSNLTTEVVLADGIFNESQVAGLLATGSEALIPICFM